MAQNLCFLDLKILIANNQYLFGYIFHIKQQLCLNCTNLLRYMCAFHFCRHFVHLLLAYQQRKQCLKLMVLEMRKQQFLLPLLRGYLKVYTQIYSSLYKTILAHIEQISNERCSQREKSHCVAVFITISSQMVLGWLGGYCSHG